jgi:cell division septation protein DedD
MSDEGVHEIQLNGKQLVFMFMAVTVVAVVIFLCGVMVGRGVRAPRATEQADAAIESPADPTAAITTPALPASGAASPATDGPGASSTSSQEKLTYADRLSTTTPPPETLKEPILQEVKAAAAVKTPAAEPPPVAPAVRTSKPAARESGSGYVVQVAAVKERSEADTIAKRLASKGFPSFVTAPSAGAARVYRVRVGKYTDRREAESVARRLEKEEQFKPWITR